MKLHRKFIKIFFYQFHQKIASRCTFQKNMKNLKLEKFGLTFLFIPYTGSPMLVGPYTELSLVNSLSGLILIGYFENKQLIIACATIY